MSIFAKYTLAVLALIFAASGVITWLSVDSQRIALRQEALLRGRTIAGNLASSGVDPFIRRDFLTLIPLAVDTQHGNAGVVYAAFVDESGKIVAHSDNSKNFKAFKLDQATPLAVAGKDVTEASVGDEWVWDLSAPIVPKEKNVQLGMVHVGISRSAVEDAVRKSRNSLITTTVIILLVGGLLSIGMVRLLVSPILTLSDAAHRIGAGELDVQVPVRSKDELGQLSSTFNSMINNLKSAEKVKLEKERIQGELNVAHSIQAGLLPDTPPKFSKIDVAFFCSPAKELGGDFYDWYALENGSKLGLVIADVSGKGVPAALHMANLRNLMRFIVHEEADPAAVMKRVNALAWPDLRGESFVTVLYAVLDLHSRELNYVSAGHEPALLVRAKDGKIEECRAKGMPVGIAEPEDFDFVMKSGKLQMESGDCFVMFTDGVTEAMNSKEEQFGRERMLDIMAKASHNSSEHGVKAVVEAVKTHAAGFEQSDDLTLLLLKTV